MLTLTVTGNLADDPQLRFTTNGKPVTNLLVISTERYRDRDTGEWTDGKTTAVRVTVWGRDDQPGLAERVAESLAKGDPVTVTGTKLTADAYLNRDGEAAATLDLTATDIQVSLRRHPVRVDRALRSGAGDAEQTGLITTAATGTQNDGQPPF